MLAKVTSKNQLTLPKAILDALGRPTYFEVTTNEGRLLLTPAHVGSPDGVRAKLAELGIEDADIRDAVEWARRQR